jgi:hypothetical protein
VTERRVKQYEVEILYGRDRGSFRQVEGWEIAKELVVGPEAYEELTGLPAGNITSKSFALSQNARNVKDNNSQPYEPWKKRNNNRRNDRRFQVERVNDFRKQR